MIAAVFTKIDGNYYSEALMGAFIQSEILIVIGIIMVTILIYIIINIRLWFFSYALLGRCIINQF